MFFRIEGGLCMLMKKGAFIFLIVLFSYCTKPSENGRTDTLFRLLDQRATGIEFVNELEYTEELNTYTFRNFYNGGGVGLGDFNNDGLLDVFLCGNLVSNELYLNKGNLKFEKIT
ncbi:MAG TPA: VCBS repeat-containing protein, partial [Chryseolinea sp.]|nr:VCBS repeat-containing protein [Chryseolinea sp.]